MIIIYRVSTISLLNNFINIFLLLYSIMLQLFAIMLHIYEICFNNSSFKIFYLKHSYSTILRKLINATYYIITLAGYYEIRLRYYDITLLYCDITLQPLMADVWFTIGIKYILRT